MVRKLWLVAIIVLVVLSADQFLKFWVKTNMTIGEELNVIGDWFKLHFTENEGMAFGFELPGSWGKLILTVFRLFAVGGIVYYLVYQVKRKLDTTSVVLIALILAGALGNIIDSVFYGVWFTESSRLELATWASDGNNYGKLLHGKVVDMFYFPLFDGTYPEWSPIKPGRSFTFFSAIFNIADAAISIGLFSILLFRRSLFSSKRVSTEEPEIETETDEPETPETTTQ